MKNMLRRLVSYLLVASLSGLPFTAQAGLIATDEAVSPIQLQADRAKVRDFVARADVQQQLQQQGLTQQIAQERVNALTDNDIQKIAGRIDALPAGGTSGEVAVVGVVLLVIFVGYAIVQLFYPQK
jgi:hypothetical protein